MINKKGITYYRLISDYENDYTKECSLTGAEIDGNFHFLRGYDIKGVLFDKETGKLALERVNGEILTVNDFNIETDISFDGSYFDENTNDLHLFINGREYVIKAVEIPYLSFVYSDDTLNGDGTLQEPLKLASTLMTGFYRPTSSIIDLTDKNNSLPKDAEDGDTFITKEYISPYGLLYNFEGVKSIMDYLKNENNGWRVPTTEDYGNMLNWLEDCEDRNHNDESFAKYPIGKRAALGIKAKRTSNKVFDNPWDTAYDDMDISNVYGFSALPAGHISNKKTKTHNGFGEEAVFWTSSIHGDMTNAYVRKLRIYDNGVTNDIQAFYNYYSLRLVKDIKHPVADVEVINGLPYNVEFIPYIDDEGNKGVLAWTKYNVTFSELLDDNEKALRIDNDKVYNEVHWFINTWNGNHWEKRELLDNSVVILKDGPDGTKNEEWILLDNEWKKRTSIFTEIIEENITKVFYEALDKEKTEREEADKVLQDNIDAEAKAREDADKVLQDNIDAEAKAREDADKVLQDNIDAEAKAREEADKVLQDNIDAEAEARKEADKVLQDNIDAEAEARKEADKALQDNIDAEAKAREDADKVLQDNIDAEAKAREEADKVLQDNIDAEAKAREEADKVLQDNIDAEAKAREDADKALQDNIDAEAKAREDADKVLQDNIDAEAKAREDADKVLQDNIDTEAAKRQEEDEKLAKAIDDEAKAREDADKVLQDNIDAEAKAREEADDKLTKEKISIEDFKVEYIPEDKKIYFDISKSKNNQQFIRVDDFLKDSYLQSVETVMVSPDGIMEPRPVIRFTWILQDGTTASSDIKVIDFLGNVYKVEPESREFLTLDDYTFTIHIGTEEDLTRGGLATYRQVHELFDELRKLIPNIDDLMVNAVKDVVLVDNWVKIEFADGTLSKGFEAKSINANVDVTELQKEIESLKGEITELKKIVNDLETNPPGITDIKSSDGDISAVKDENGVVTLTLNGISN